MKRKLMLVVGLLVAVAVPVYALTFHEARNPINEVVARLVSGQNRAQNAINTIDQVRADIVTSINAQYGGIVGEIDGEVTADPTSAAWLGIQDEAAQTLEGRNDLRDDLDAILTFLDDYATSPGFKVLEWTP